LRPQVRTTPRGRSGAPALAAVALLAWAACRPIGAPPPDRRSPGGGLSLAGTWQARIDEADAGLAAGWAEAALVDAGPVLLPGSLAAAGLGHRFDPDEGRYEGLAMPPYLAWPSAGYTDAHRRDELGALVAARSTVGPAWFERLVTVPPGFAGRRLRLTLGRVKWSSAVWVDGVRAEPVVADSLHAPHLHDCGPLAAGPHRITLRIDNRPLVDIGLAGHGYGMETEPLWLGVAGDLTLAVLDPLRVEGVVAAPTDDPRRVRVVLRLAAAPGAPSAAELAVEFVEPDSARVLGRASRALGPGEAEVALDLALDEPARRWDEFTPQLYTLVWTVRADGEVVHRGQRRVGMRRLRRDGRQILLDGAPLFLRGNLDCAIHPATDTPPTDRAFWERVLGVQKAAGFNHVRFHTWCPPDAAFDVADELGLYLQVETAYWVDDWVAGTPPFPDPIGADPKTDAWVEAEALRIVTRLGHHPSFALFCIGNEFGLDGTDWDQLQAITARLDAATDHALVAATTARRATAVDQFHVTHRTDGGPVRGIGPAHTDWDFSRGVAAAALPVVAHETGQRPSWPDYDALLPRFAGVPQPWNLRRLRARAEAAGCLDHHRRAEASARFALLQYKHEHEALRRTPGLAGYQLLMLHDFTGQGEAHVGLLDPFFEPKPGITLDAIRGWNGPTVPLARFGSYLWTSDQDFEARLLVAHEGPAVWTGVRPRWRLTVGDGRTFAEGELAACDLRPHGLTGLGAIRVPLRDAPAPAALRLTVQVGACENGWDLWVYPPADRADLDPPDGVLVRRHLDTGTVDALTAGARVLLLPQGTILPTARSLSWPSTYWTGAWGWGDGLGLLIEPGHPALAGFPTPPHSDWPWRGLVDGGLGVAVPAAFADRAAIVEQLADFHRPARELCLFEARVGAGRLLVCGLDLSTAIDERPAARALRASLLRYAASDGFAPRASLSAADAVDLLRAVPFGAWGIAAITADSAHAGHPAANVLDGDPATIWHTPWGAVEPPYPHRLEIDLGEVRTIRGLDLLQRQDQDRGRVAEVAVFVRAGTAGWSRAVATETLANAPDLQRLRFEPVAARFVRVEMRREVGGRNWASLAELAVVGAAASPADDR
jgi:hypothetical protein